MMIVQTEMSQAARVERQRSCSVAVNLDPAEKEEHIVSKKRRFSQFLHLHMPSSLHASGIRTAEILPNTKNYSASVSCNLNIPTVSVTSPHNDENKRFSFGFVLRRHSNVVS